MIIDLVKIINEKQKKGEDRKKEILKKKFYEIRGALIKYYATMQIARAVVDIPPFMLADNLLKEMVKTKEDVEFYYKMLRKYNACEEVR